MKRISLLCCFAFLLACENAMVPYYTENGCYEDPFQDELSASCPSVDTELEEEETDYVYDTHSVPVFPDTGSMDPASGDEDTTPETVETSFQTEVETVETESDSESFSATGEETVGDEETTATVEAEDSETGSGETVVETSDDTVDTYFASDTEPVDSDSESVIEDTGIDSDTGSWVDTNPDTDLVTDPFPDTGPIPCPLNDAQFGGRSDTCWYMGDFGESCLDVCEKYDGEYSWRTIELAGFNGGDMNQCYEIALWFKPTPVMKGLYSANLGLGGLGCTYSYITCYITADSQYTQPGAKDDWHRRVCACVIY
jgi:hypothetical protein